MPDGKGFGVGQAGEPVHGAVQVGVADPRPGPAFGLQRLGATAAVSGPAATAGDGAAGPPRPG